MFSDSLAEPQAFVLGVNYWPRRRAMYWWSDFDADEVQEEFSLIRDLGLGVVRIFLLWEDWQPTPDSISPTALLDLEIVFAIAERMGLQLDVTFFTGHMSGPNWAPRWMLRQGELPAPGVRQVVSGGEAVASSYANPFSDPAVTDAAELFLQTVVSRLAGHPAIGLWNLGNEPDLFAWPTDAAAGRAWVRRMAGLIHEIDPTTPVTCGLHIHSLVEDNGLRVHEVFDEVDVPVMHGYPMYADWARDPLDPDFVPFLCALTEALCGRPVLMEEFGGPTAAQGVPSATWMWQRYGQPSRVFVASEEAFAEHLEAVLYGLVDAGALGAMLWCFADYEQALWTRPPCDESWHERHFGLVRPDGTLKPHADVVRRFAASGPVSLPRVPRGAQPARRMVSLDMTAEEYYRNPLAHARRLYAAWTSTS